MRKSTAFEDQTIVQGMGNRIAKHVLNENFKVEKSTFYVLDASGNVMATYDKEIDYERGETFFKLKEHVVYGSSRVGIRTHDMDLLGIQNQGFSMRSVHYSIGSRQYELTNHLGNVLSVVSDKVIPNFDHGVIAEMWADIRVAQDYSPFGVTLSRRNFSVSEGYRYGYQGSEKDDEVKGDGNSYTTYFRQLDPRLGRWLSIDPKAGSLPWQSPYCSMDNSPISLNDRFGDTTPKEEKKLKKEQKSLIKKLDKLSEKEKIWAGKVATKKGSVVERDHKIDENENTKSYVVADKEGAGITVNKSIATERKKLIDRHNEITNTVEGYFYEEGEIIGIQVSFSSEMFVGGGLSVSMDFVFVADDIVLGGTFGGGVGIGGGSGVNAGIITCNLRGRYNAYDIQDGNGFSFSAGIGPLSYSRSGDGDGARWNGETNTIGGADYKSAIEKANYIALYQAIYTRSLSTLKGKASINYQNTRSSVWKQW